VLPSAAADCVSLLIRNVTLIDSAAGAKEVTVNVVIKDTRLHQITEDDVPNDPALKSVDAAGGAVLGQLRLGEPASFLILDGDPRENVALLLDNKTYARFATHQGKIL
jgi:imidazolonepropionase-like amidohydrolase